MTTIIFFLPMSLASGTHYIYLWVFAVGIPLRSLPYMLRGRADHLRDRSRSLCHTPRWLIILKHDRGYPTILAF